LGKKGGSLPRGGRNRIGRREKWPKKSWEEGEIGSKSREEGEIDSESREKGGLLACSSPLHRKEVISFSVLGLKNSWHNEFTSKMKGHTFFPDVLHKILDKLFSFCH